MLGLQALDVAIGLVFVYLLLSLVCTTVNEFVSQAGHARAKWLYSGVQQLLGSADTPERTESMPVEGPGAPKDPRDTEKQDVAASAITLTADELFDHPLVAALNERHFFKAARPSYIPAPTFAMALLDLVLGEQPRTVQSVITSADKLPRSLGRPLRIFASDAKDLASLQASLERWYNDAMERRSGAYKRKTQLILLAIACLVTLGANADTFRIARALSTNPALRDALVAQARSFAEHPPVGAHALSPGGGPTGGPTAPANAQLAPDAGDAGASVKAIRAVIDSIQSMGLPLGWTPAPTDSASTWQATVEYHLGDAASRLPGLLLTALALTLGAPFWFDTLNKIITVRSAGRAPDETPKKPEALPPAK